MSWLRQSIGAGESFSQIKAHLERDFENLDGLLVEMLDNIRTLQRFADLNGVILLYAWEDTTGTTTAPPAGFIKGNANQATSITEFAVNLTDAYGREIMGHDNLSAGDLITLAASDLSASHVYVADGPAVFDAARTFARIPVTVATTGGYNPQQGEYVRLSWRPANIAGGAARNF